jgi:hypothetical protein
MKGERVDVYLRPAQQVDPLDVCVRVDGLPEEKDRAAVGKAVGLSLRRGAPPSPEEAAPARPSVDRTVELGVGGQWASRHRWSELDRVVRGAVDDELDRIADRARAADICICASGVPGDRINLRPEEIVWYVNGVWTPPPNAPPGDDSWVIAVALDSAPFNYARLILRNGATFDPPVRRDQVLVGLANATDWAKEIWADNLCSGRLASVYQDGPDTTPHRMLLGVPNCRDGTDTIVFRKPGFFGIWHDVGHFPPELFWQAFGGTVADFTWVID